MFKGTRRMEAYGRLKAINKLKDQRGHVLRNQVGNIIRFDKEH